MSKPPVPTLTAVFKFDFEGGVADVDIKIEDFPDIDPEDFPQYKRFITQAVTGSIEGILNDVEKRFDEPPSKPWKELKH